MTALHWGCSKGHLDAVKLLIEYQAFPNHMEMTEDRFVSVDILTNVLSGFMSHPYTFPQTCCKGMH